MSINPGKAGDVARQLEVLWTSGTLTGVSDAQLLREFAESRGRGATSESAFRELVNRHGPMVMGVCRQILRRPYDADDAFQATFLVLVRKARSIRVGDSLAPWLYGVAYRTAHRARTIASRYRPADVEPTEEPMGPSSDDAYDFDLRPLLHEELSRLPGKYRDPIVLCHLEGKSHEEAARLLQWPVGTLSGRLSRGRQILKSRLERRGVAVSPVMLAANWLAGTSTVVATPLIESTVNVAVRLGAATAISTSVLSLTQGVLRTMLLNQMKSIAFVILVAGGVSAGGVGVWAYQASRPSSQPAQDNEPAPPKVLAKAKDTASAPQPPPRDPFDPDLKSESRPAAIPPQGFAMGAMTRLKNSPNMVGPWEPMGTHGMRSYLVVESPDRTSLQAMSLEGFGGTWKKLPLPPGIKALPLMGEDVVALSIKGKTIDHVAVFNTHNGEWSKQHLLKPVEDEINPVIGPGCALYQSGNDFYAFSSSRGKWGVLHLEGDEKPKAKMLLTSIQVLQGNTLYVFSLKFGEWSSGVDVNLHPFQSEPPQAAPAN
jgi:RNA polymerase sigma factor (sigma-70 family)